MIVISPLVRVWLNNKAVAFNLKVDMDNLRKSKFRPFSEAREYIRSLNFKTRNEYRTWSKSLERPQDIPSAPELIYKGEWISLGDWLGTGKVANQRRAFKPFDEARAFVISLKFQAQDEYRAWSKSSERPSDIPADPSKTYKTEWISWGDWLGTDAIASQNRVFIPFNEARAFVRSLNFKGKTEHRAWSKSSERPSDIPSLPSRTYKTEWIGWGDWLGTFTIAPFNRVYRPFNEARDYVRSLNFKSSIEYAAWSKSTSRPHDISTVPAMTYKTEWISWGDWLGTDAIASQNRVFIPFNEARAFVRSLNFKGVKVYEDWSKSAKRPNDIPSAPGRIYKGEWISWGDWLGTYSIANTKRAFKPFAEAKLFVRDLNFKNIKEYSIWSKTSDRPLDIPTTPEQVYKEWLGWGDWLGTNNIATQNRKYREFNKARDLVRGLKLSSRNEFSDWAKTQEELNEIPLTPSHVYKTEWISWGDWLGTGAVANSHKVFRTFNEARVYVRSLKFQGKDDYMIWSKSAKRPNDIPSTPTQTYKTEWISWGDWLGYYSVWSKNALIGFVKSLYPILPYLDPSELYSILRNNNCLNAIEQLGDDSPLKRLINDTLHGDLEGIAKTYAEIDKLKTSASDEEILSDTPISEHEIIEEIIPTELDVEELPKLSPTQTLDNLDHLENVLGISDEETVEFLINKALGRHWGQVLRSATPDDEIESIRAHTGATYSTQVKDRFLEQYTGATSLPIPTGYAFKKNGELIEPNLMQRLVAYRLLTEHRLGNWSGTGAGKTLGAILGSRAIDARLTIIIGLNNTILDEKSGWASEINNAFPSSNILIKEKRGVIYSETQPNYLLLNYETFQLGDSKVVVDEILDSHKVDLIVLDEVHSAKSRNQMESKRRTLINYLLLKASEANPDLRVLGMSATPVVNSLDEAVSLIEMIKGREYNELDTAPKLSNALAIHEQLVINGIRYVPNYAIELKETPVEIADNSIASELQSIGKGQVLQIEIALLRAKLNTIVELCKPGTIVYSIFVDEIFDMIANAVKGAGLRVARFNGYDKTGIELFKQGKVDVLIGSSALSTGVDGLQYVCNRLIITCLPWTSAGYEQLKGRIYRQGSKFTEVEVFIPQVTLTNKGDTWSWDKQRLARIKYKKTLADAAVDGAVPEANLASPALMLVEAKKALNDWVARLESGEVYELSRDVLKVPLPPEAITKAIHKYGDFSAMNQRYNSSKSTTMHDRLVADPEEFYLYHSLYREARETWSEVPYKVIAEQLNKRPDWVIGDFGCGEALLSKSVRNKVYSFDHVAINPSVVVCDMAYTGLDAEILDVAVFSLSLMGVNWEDYLKEAFRLLRSGSLLKVSEPASGWSENNFASLKKGIEVAGFVLNGEPRLSSKFIYIDAIKPL